MAYSQDLNNISPVSQAAAIYDLKEAMKAAGYLVRGSGDGIATASAVGDIITTAASGAGGMDNTNAWFTIRQPATGAAPYAGTREWTFQRGTLSYAWFVQYSGPSTTFDQTTGNATTRPTLLDTQYLMNVTGSGSQTNILPTFLNFTYQIRVGDAAEDFHWYLISYPNGGGNINGRVSCIPMAADSIPSAELDPFNMAANPSALLTTIICSQTSNAAGFAYQGIDKAFGTNTPQLCPPSYYQNQNGFFFPIAAGSNPVNGDDDGAPIPWGRTTKGNQLRNGFKGYSLKVKWAGTSRVTGDTLDSLNYIIFDQTIWQWDGATVPSV